MSRKIRTRGKIKRTIPRKTRDGPLERAALQITSPTSRGERRPCGFYSVCPNRKRCDKYGTVAEKGKRKMNERCLGYSPEEY